MRVRWTMNAADDLERICDYIAESRPESARRWRSPWSSASGGWNRSRSSDDLVASRVPERSPSLRFHSLRFTRSLRVRVKFGCSASYTAPNNGHQDSRSPEQAVRASASAQPQRSTWSSLNNPEPRVSSPSDTALNMRKLVCAAGLVLALSACSHTPMRPFDCEAVLGLRLGQSPDDVKALIGKPYLEEAGETWWRRSELRTTECCSKTLAVDAAGWEGVSIIRNTAFARPRARLRLASRASEHRASNSR
jgi:hypothetical protein